MRPAVRVVGPDVRGLRSEVRGLHSKRESPRTPRGEMSRGT